MKTVSALLLVMLHCFLQLSSSAPAASSFHDCCAKFTLVKKIPLKQVDTYMWSRSDCSLKAIVFTTKLGKKFCVDPNIEWVRDHVTAVDQRVKLTTARPSITNSTISSSTKLS